MSDIFDSHDEAAAREAAESRKEQILVDRDAELLTKDGRRLLEEAPGVIFRGSGDRLVRVGHDEDGRVILRQFDKDSLREVLAARAEWLRVTQRNEQRPAGVPPNVIGEILASPDLLNVPTLTRVVSAPVFGPGGTILTTPGYHADARVWYEPSGDLALPPVPTNPMRADLDIAHDWMSHLLGDFPFASAADYLNAVSLVLLPFARSMINGPTPMHVIESPTVGTGKTTLASCTTWIVNGSALPKFAETTGDEEWRKRITAALLAGQPFIAIDNVRGRVDWSPVAQALTAGVVTDRILGKTAVVEVKVDAGWILTANNPRFSREIAERSVRIRLDGNRARPSQRGDWRHPDLEGWVAANRGALVWSALTMIQAWVAAGRPQAPKCPNDQRHRLSDWFRVMAGIHHVNSPARRDPPMFLANQPEFLDLHDDHDDHEELCTVLATWWETFGDGDVTTGDVAKLAIRLPGTSIPVTAVSLIVGDNPKIGDSERSMNTALAAQLRALHDQILCDRWKITIPNRTLSGRKLWSLKLVG